MTVAAQAATVAEPDAVLSYDLTFQDALAWERHDPVQRKRTRVACGGAVFAGIALLSVTTRHLPDWLSRLHSNALAVVILCLPLVVLLAVQRRDRQHRARIALPAAVNIRLDLWPRRMVEHRGDRDAPRAIGAQALRGVIATAGHVFLFTRSDHIIVPQRAFADAASKAAFVRHWAGLAM